MHVQAGRIEVGKLGPTGQSTFVSLPAWQQARLSQLGIELGLEVSLGREPAAEPRLVAGVRILAATQETQLLGRSIEQLGDLLTPLHSDVEVRSWH